MWWETAIVLVAVVLSAAYLSRAAVRSLRGRSRCASACGKCPPTRETPRASVREPLDFRDRFARPSEESRR